MKNLLKNESVDNKTVLDDFRTYLQDEKIPENEVDEDIINDYFTGFFYDIETEEDMNDLNDAEEIIRKHYGLNESKKSKVKNMKSEAIYLVTPDEKSNEINLDEIMKAVDEITDTVKQNDATDFAQEVAEVPAGNTVTDETEIVESEPEVSDDGIVDLEKDSVVEEGEPIEVIDVSQVSEPDATDVILDVASTPGTEVTSDVQADEVGLPVTPVEESNGPLFVLAEQLISAHHTITSLHRNLIGGAWFSNHSTLDEYGEKILEAVDEVIEQNIELGGREPSAMEAICAFPPCEITGRDKNETYRLVRDLFNSIVTLMEECKSGIPGDVISKIEEYQNYFRKEANYKLARTILGESKLMTVEEMKKEKLLEATLAQAKADAKKDALETGDDQYIYQDGDEIYYTDESPKQNPKLFNRVQLVGKYITDMNNGRMVVNYFSEPVKEKKYVSTSKFKRRLSEEKIGDVEIQDSMEYIGNENNPELEDIASDKISFEEFMKQHKDEIDQNYKMTYGDEINKDLYNALADYMYNDSITGNVQTKKEYVDPIDETEENKELVNDSKNESLYRGDTEVDAIDYEVSHGSKPSNNTEGQWFFATYKGDIKDYDSDEVVRTPALKFKDAADYAIKEFKNRGLNPYRIYVKG